MSQTRVLTALLGGVLVLLLVVLWPPRSGSSAGDTGPAPAREEVGEAADTRPELDRGPAQPEVSAAKPEPAAQREEQRAGSVVRVLSPDGQGVSRVVVAAGMRIPSSGGGLRLAAGSTDERGHAPLLLDHARRERVAAFPPNPELAIDARIATATRVRASKLMAAFEAEGVTLTLPETRLLQIEVRHADGSPVDFPVGVSASWAPRGTPAGDEAWGARRPETLPQDGARAFLVCALDVDLRLQVWDETRRFVAGHLELAGPTAADPPVRVVELRLGEESPRFRARFVDEAGAPLAGVRLAQHQTMTPLPTEARPEPKPVTRWQTVLETDAEGRIDITVPSNQYTKRHERNWSFVLSSSDRSVSLPGLDEEGAVQVSVTVPRELAPGQVVDAGDLVLREQQHPLLVAGRVIGPDGERRSAIISVTTDEENWQDRNRLWQGRPERDGSFAVRAAAPADGRVRISAGGFGQLGVEEVVPVGTTDLELVMRTGTTLRGFILLPDGLPVWEMEIRMPGGRSKEIFPGGSFSVDYLRANPESWVSLEHHGRELWRSGPLSVPEGDPEFRPEALQGVDLRGKLRAWSIRFVDASGAALTEAISLQCLTPDGTPNHAWTAEDGGFTQVVPIEVDTLQLRVRGAEPVQLSWPPPAEVVLRKSVR